MAKYKRFAMFSSIFLLFLFGIFLSVIISSLYNKDEIAKLLVSNTNTNLTNYGTFLVPFHFTKLRIPPTQNANPFLVANLQGSGIITAIAFHENYYGIAVGYSTDNGPVHYINNGDCLIQWSANSPNAKNFPVKLLSYKNKYDLSIGVNTPIKFKQDFKLYFVNSAKQAYQINSLHIYGYFKNLKTGPGNLTIVN